MFWKLKNVLFLLFPCRWARSPASPHISEKKSPRNIHLKRNPWNIFRIILNLSENLVYKFVCHGVFSSWQTVSSVFVRSENWHWGHFLFLPKCSKGHHLSKHNGWPRKLGILLGWATPSGTIMIASFHYCFIQNKSLAWLIPCCRVLGR